MKQNVDKKEESVRREDVHKDEQPNDPRAEIFVNFYTAMRLCKEHGIAEKALFLEDKVWQTLKDVYGWDAGRAIFYLLEQLEESKVRDFAYHYLRPSWMLTTHVDVIVRANMDIATIRGNVGQYVIRLRKDGSVEEQQLHFTHRSSCIYYLLFLIHRRRNNGFLHPLQLRKNRDAFIDLYQIVYGGTTNEAALRYDKLLRRQDGSRIRVGRESEIIYDIRRHLQAAFAAYNESFLPYAMTANSHLSIAPGKIYLEGLASAKMQRMVIY